MTENQQWRDMRHRLYNQGARRLWAYAPGELDGTHFGLECFATDRGPVIFQVWPDAGFEVFHTEGAPSTLDDLEAWCTGNDVPETA